MFADRRRISSLLLLYVEFIIYQANVSIFEFVSSVIMRSVRNLIFFRDEFGVFEEVVGGKGS